MKIERLREIMETLNTQAQVDRMNVTFMAGTDKLQLAVGCNTQDRYEKAGEILTEIKNEFALIENYRIYNSGLDMSFLDQIDFIDLYNKIAYGIEADIKALIANPPLDPIYAFTVGLSPEHYSIENNANTEVEWKKYKEKLEGSKSDATMSSKYWAPHFSLNHELANFEFWSPLYEAFEHVQTIASKHFELTGGRSQFFTQWYTSRLLQMTIHALKKKLHLFEEVRTTDDFVAYVQDPVGNGDELFTAMETMSFERAAEIHSSGPS